VKVQVLVGTDVYEVEMDNSSKKVAGCLNLGLSASKADQSLVPQLSSHKKVFDLEKETKLCRSPLAGIVAHVNIADGGQVEAGDVMIVLEAMKMETNVSAPTAVKAKSVKVVPGDVVKPDQILVEFE